MPYTYNPTHLPHIVHRRPDILNPMREGTVRAVLDTEAPRVRVMHAHARLVVAQVVAPLCVARSAVQEVAPAIWNIY